MTRRILSIAENIEVSNTLTEDYIEDNLLIDHNVIQINHSFCFGKLCHKIRYSIFDRLLCQLLVYKMPSLYINEEKKLLKYEIYNLLMGVVPKISEENEWRVYQYEMEFKLNDNINNPIFSDYELFVEIIEDLYDYIYSDGYRLINYEECKRTIKEIRMECNFACGDLFEL